MTAPPLILDLDTARLTVDRDGEDIVVDVEGRAFIADVGPVGVNGRDADNIGDLLVHYLLASN